MILTLTARTIKNIFTLSLSLSIGAFYGLSSATYGQSTTSLKAQNGVLDISPHGPASVDRGSIEPPVQASPTVQPQTTLNGAVTHTEATSATSAADANAGGNGHTLTIVPNGGSITIGPGGISITGAVTGTKNGVTLNGDQLKAILQHTDGITFGSRRPQMSSDDFRALEYGVIGLDARVHSDTIYPVIINLFPTCPAAEAGIKPGDLLVQAGDHVFQLGDGQSILWRVVGGKAGTPVDITVLRDGEKLTFHLIRMNIEDVQDVKIRRNYESILQAFGPPGQTH